MAEDWLGNEYVPGDFILYPIGYGAHGCQMILAQVREIKDSTVTAVILKRSRSAYVPSMLVDSRTGKEVRGGKLHVKKESHYRHKETGEETGSPYRIKGFNWKEVSNLYEYVPVKYWEYVTKGPYVATLRITDNITKAPDDIVRKWKDNNEPSQDKEELPDSYQVLAKVC